MTTESPPLRLTVAAEQKGLRLDKYLNDHSGVDKTRSQWKKLIEDGEILVQGRKSKASSKLKAGDLIEIHLPPPTDMELIPEDIPLDILFEDEHLLVVNKPASMVVHPAPGHSTGTLVHAVLHHCDDLSGVGGVRRPGIVHRIDRDTTGALVVAKHDQAHLGLAHLFKHRPEGQIERRYLAIVRGPFHHDYGKIETLYDRHPKHRQRYSSKVSSGREAVTEYWVKERYSLVTLLELKLQTGRTHQIRVHMADRQRALIGDPVYGRKSPSNWPNALKNFPRQALHATSLSFVHPITGEWISCHAPLPDDMKALLEELRRLDGIDPETAKELL